MNATSQIENPPEVPRRSFLAALLAAGTAGVGLLLAVPVVRFVLHPVLARTTAMAEKVRRVGFRM